MRPVRALGLLALLVAAWLWWRAPIVAVELDRLSAAAHFAAAQTDIAANDLSGAIKEAQIGLREVPGDRQGVTLLRRLVRLLHPMLAHIADAEQPYPPMPIHLQRMHVAILRPRQSVASAITHPTTTFPPAPPVTTSPVHSVAAATIEAAVIRPKSVEPLAADDAYRLLASGKRRKAATAFHAALTRSPSDPRASTWKRQLALLEKRWSGSAYSLLRSSGASDLAARPVLGGGQSGVQVAYALDPLASRPVSVEARGSAPNSGARDGAQAALGVSWQVHPAVSLTVERLFKVGEVARGGWTARVAGGVATPRPAAKQHWIDASVYAEAGAVGLRDTAYYGAIQGRIGRATSISRGLTVSAGIGGWASVQRDAATVSRAEFGPTVRVRSGAIEAAADYRFRVAGNAAPGSGPVVTLAANY